MCFTVPVNTLIPILFGLFLYRCLLALDRESDALRLTIGALALLVALPFPFYCNQAIVLVARRLQWVDRELNPEAYEKKLEWFWVTCAALAVACLTLMGYVLITQQAILLSNNAN